MPNKIYIFKKSGQLVKIISATRIGKRNGYTVERIDSGKQFFAPKDSLTEFETAPEEK